MASDLTKAEAIKRLYAYDVAPYLEYKERGGSKIPFVGWDSVVAILDDVLPGEWDSQQMAQALVGGKLVLTWRLTLHCADGDIIRESLGDEEEERDTYGTAATNAESQAKRRAAANFGLGLALYDKAKRREIEQRAARGAQPAPQARAATGNGHSAAAVPPAGARKELWEMARPELLAEFKAWRERAAKAGFAPAPLSAKQVEAMAVGQILAEIKAMRDVLGTVTAPALL